MSLPPASIVLIPLAVGAGFSVYQADSPLFACGRDLAGWEIYAWLALSGLQGVLYLLATRTEAAKRLYDGSQILLLPVLALVAGQLALAYPRIIVVTGLGAIAYWIAAAGVRWIRGKAVQADPVTPVAAVAETATFLLAAAVIHSTIAFLVLYTPGRVLDDRLFLAIAAVSALVAGVLVRRERAPFASLRLGDVPPLALLLLVLLRAKLPDPAYDSLFYKATLPLLIGEWRTALTGILDHSLVGTNFLEIVNAQARIIDRDYSPAMGGTLAMAALWLLAPAAARTAMPASLGTARGMATAGCALLIVSLTEPLIAAGTAYHEPMLALLMTAALLPIAPAWLFLGAAVAAKITVVFALPVLVAMKVMAWAGEQPAVLRPPGAGGAMASALGYLRHVAKSRPAATAACLLLAALAVGQQLDRNLAQTGRLLAVTEILSGWTDPEGRVLARQERNPVFDAVAQRGALEKYGKTFIHVLTLDRWIVPDELGFHVMPTSRLIAVAALLALLAPLVPALRRRPATLLMLVLWVACAAAALNFFSQGRHLFPLSLAAAVVVPWVVAVAMAGSTGLRGGLPVVACFVLAATAFGDQVVGSFINNGWECRRPLRAPVVTTDYDRPTTPLEKRLAEIVAQYRAIHPPATGEPPPTVLCESPTDRLRYFGAHYVYAHASFKLTLRRLAARPDDAARLPTGLLAVCFANAAFFESAVPPAQRKHYVEVPGAGNIRIMVSEPLMRGERATSLAGARPPWFAAIASAPPTQDFVANWSVGRLTDASRADAPGGKGSFTTPIEGRQVAVLLSPFGVVFDDVRYPEASQLEVEAAMPYANSDGMTLSFVIEGGGGNRHVVPMALRPRPADAAGPAFERRAIAIPADVEGRGSLRVEASSPSGDPIADWAYLRLLRIAPAAR